MTGCGGRLRETGDGVDELQAGRDAVQVAILNELRWLRKHMEYITKAEEDCEITELEECADGT